jgi:hypothetical protein
MSQANGWSGAIATKARRYWASRVANGDVQCWRCGKLIDPAQPWDVGHLVDIAAGGPLELANTAPECRGPNRAAGARLGTRNRVARNQARRDEPRGVRAWV